MSEPVAKFLTTVFADGEVPIRKLPLTAGGAPATPRAAARKGPSARSAPAQPPMMLSLERLKEFLKAEGLNLTHLYPVLGIDAGVAEPNQPTVLRMARDWVRANPERAQDAGHDMEMALAIAAIDAAEQAGKAGGEDST